MARADVIVLGAGIVGTSIALHLAKRGLSVALVDRAGPGEGTSYGNTGIIEGNTIFPQVFPVRLDGAVAHRAQARAGSQLSSDVSAAKVAPWLAAFRAASRPERLLETAQLMRPLFARAVVEHEALVADAGAERYLRRNGWLKLYRGDRSFAAQTRELELASSLGIANVALDGDAARALEPSLAPVFRHAVHWTGAMSVSNPLALTRAYAARFAALGGIALTADARTLHRPSRIGASTAPADRSTPAMSWSRSVRGRRTCSVRSASSCRWPSSGAITGTFRRKATRRSAARCSMPKTVTASRRWSRASA